MSNTEIGIVGQIPAELDRLRELYWERKPKRVLEIGVFYGGTLREWLAGTPEVVVAVDPFHRNPHLYDEWLNEETELVEIAGYSHDLNIQASIAADGPYDWIFIDGDHDEPVVTRDIELALRVAAPGAVILIHDIVAEGYPPIPPRIHFDRLAQHYKSWEIVEPRPAWWPRENGHGIGVIEVGL